MIIQAINRSQIKNYIPDNQNIVAICIYSVGDVPPIVSKGFKNILYLQISDIDKSTPTEIINKHNLILFSKSHAGTILDFINKNTPNKVIINCDAGISRSIGVMVALENIYNKNNLFNKFPLHNKYIANTIIKIWEKRQF